MQFQTLIRTLVCCSGVIAVFSSTAQENPVPKSTDHGHNRIEVSGNNSGTVQVICSAGEAADVSDNSVDIDRRALRGRTVIVTDHNSGNTAVQDCGKTGSGRSAEKNVNSVLIR